MSCIALYEPDETTADAEPAHPVENLHILPIPNSLKHSQRFSELPEHEQEMIVLTYRELLTSTIAHRQAGSIAHDWLPIVPVPFRRVCRWFNGNADAADAALRWLETEGLIELITEQKLPHMFRLQPTALVAGLGCYLLTSMAAKHRAAVSEIEHCCGNASAVDSILYGMMTSLRINASVIDLSFRGLSLFEQLKRLDALTSLRSGCGWAVRDLESGTIVTPLLNTPREWLKHVDFNGQSLCTVTITDLALLCVGLLAREHRGDREDVSDFLQLVTDGKIYSELARFTGKGEPTIRKLVSEYLHSTPDQLSPNAVGLRDVIGDNYPSIVASVAFHQWENPEDFTIVMERIRSSILESAVAIVLTGMPSNGCVGVLSDGLLVLPNNADAARTAIENAFRNPHGITPPIVTECFGE